MSSTRIHRSLAAAVLLSATLAGCASGRGGQEGPSRADEDVITTEELEQASDLDLFTLIDRLRPRWLRARQERTFTGETRVAVFVDGVRRGNAGTLRSIRTVTVEEVRYLNARDATTMYGPDMGGGAILVFTRR